MTDAKVRIFVSSPSDVDHERALVRDIIEQLAQEYLSYFQLEPILWEEEALTADRTFQAGLLQPADCDIVLVVLWTRLGTPLPEEPYQGRTGTEWEFLNAVDASARLGRPEVLVFKKTSPRLVDITNPQATQAALDDRLRLEAFFAAHFFNPDRTFRRAFRTFANDAAFRELVEAQLRRLLNRRISVEKRGRDGPTWRGSPFRASAPFALADERIFTGREREVRELVHRIAQTPPAHLRLLLVTGPSGCGKTSLLAAGLLAALARPFLIEGVAGCRWCRLDPSVAAATTDRLALELLGQDALGVAFGEMGMASADLARLLAGAPALAARQVGVALRRQAQLTAVDSGGTADRLLLAVVVDPLEGLLGSGDAETAGRALLELAAIDDVWVIAAMRSDRLPELARLGVLSARLDETHLMTLEPLPAARIRQVIQIPARVAGLALEGDEPGAGRSLVELLEAEASRLEHWPPLLQRTLERLRSAEEIGASAGPPGDLDAEAGGDEAQVADRSATRVTLAAYRASGGLAGVTLAWAETVWAGLDDAARAALPRLCRGLIAVEGSPSSAPLCRSGDLATLQSDPACARLLAALIEARLVAADGRPEPSRREGSCPVVDYRLSSYLRQILRESGEGWRARLSSWRRAAKAVPAAASERAATLGPAGARWRELRPTASFTHPRLLTDWPPVRDWLAQPANHRLVQLRTQLTRQALLWRRTDCNREYLLGEAGFAMARPLLTELGGELEPVEAEYLDHSARHLGFQRRRSRAFRAFALLLVGLLAIASTAAFQAWHASQEATLSLQRSLLNAADLAVSRGNTPLAIRLALDAGPYLPELAIDTLSRAFTGNHLIAMAQVSDPAQAAVPALREDGERLATLIPDVGVQLWRLADRAFVPERLLSGPEPRLHHVLFAGADEGARVIGLGRAGIWRLPTAAGTPPDYRCASQPDSLAAIDPSGRFLAVTQTRSAAETGVCLVDLTEAGRILFERPVHEQEIRSLVFSPDGAALLTASRDGRARLLARDDGRELLALPAPGPLGRPINRAVFDTAGERIALASADDRVRLYRRDGVALAELHGIARGGKFIPLHKSAVRDIAFAPDGRFLVAVDDKGQVVRWGLASEATADVLGHHELGVELVRLSPAKGSGLEPLVLTASLDKTARLWGLETGQEYAAFSHDAAVSDARFSGDGRRVLSYSRRDGSVRLWGVEPVSRLAYRLGHGDHVWSIAIAAAPGELAPAGDALLLATAAFDGTVGVWRYDRRAAGKPPRRLRHLVGHTDRVRRVQFAPDARRLASAAYDGTVRVWDLVDGYQVCVLAAGTDGARPPVHQALFGPHGDWLLTASSDPAAPLRLWDPVACRALPVPSAFATDGGAAVQALAVQADGTTGAVLVASGDDAGRVQVRRWDPAGSWSLLCGQAVHSSPVLDLAIAPDAGLVASASEDGQAALIALGSDRCGPAQRLDGHGGTLYSLRFAPDGTRLVTASLDGTARIWRRDGAPVATLAGHADRIYQAAFSPDGAWLLTASRDGQVRLWRNPPTPTAEPQSSYLVLGADLGGVADAVFSPDGQYIAAAYWENAAQLWRLWADGDGKAPRGLVASWGPDRARLVLIREAERFRRSNRLDQHSEPMTP